MNRRISPCPRCGALTATESLVCAQCGATRESIASRATRSTPYTTDVRSFKSGVSVLSTPAEAAHDMRAILQPNQDFLAAVHAALLTCSHVASNKTFSDVASDVWVHCCRSSSAVACASRSAPDTPCRPCHFCNETPGAGGAYGTIVMPEVLLRLAGVLAAFVGGPLLASRDVRRVSTARTRMRQCADYLRAPDAMGGLGAQSWFERVNEVGRDPAQRVLATDIMRGIVTNVLAHEMGHLVYGHTDGPESLHEVSRNSEREADSFAASALSTMPHPERALLGSVLFWSCLIHQSRLGSTERAVTHPLNVERLNAMIHSMPSAMRTLEAIHELTESDLRDLAAA